MASSNSVRIRKMGGAMLEGIESDLLNGRSRADVLSTNASILYVLVRTSSVTKDMLVFA